ncbi:type II secretion system protein [Fonticella tunisiensis]|uniref:Prepilin-type N-terminal cleavage/methylation domain-containing protein n=1 Tax=Fonticella tunisiensis TaxID=1096341 RepID=A0A4R7KSK9_9CLOT|nr:prepilin-type N-terminal cleavage/methylation domain-containing protein [Fonticella tunisiensis]TDT61968.1 prepilin-type N-terminal cleavage/methylation domain-containing protein [Fonticella tunisiensis]
MKRKNSRKKKGFTLVELIAVIAILGILAAIVVPKVSNYTAAANNAKLLANAKTIAQAVELYNTEQDNAANPITEQTSIDEIKTKLMPSSGTKYLSSWPNDLGGWQDYGDIIDYIQTADQNNSSQSNGGN